MVDRLFTYDEMVQLWQLAYEKGRADGYGHACALAGAGDLSWQLAKRLTHADHVARRLAVMEAAAAVHDRERGFRYEGGPVDWETGRPLRERQLVAA